MEKEELLLPVQASVNSSHRLHHSPRYTSPLLHPYTPPPPHLNRSERKNNERKKEKEKHIIKERIKEERVSLKRENT